VKVSIPSALHSYTSKKSEASASGKTLAEVMQDLDRQFPGMRFRIIDEQDQIRPHIKIFVNREQVRGLDVALKATDEIAIVQAFSGG